MSDSLCTDVQLLTKPTEEWIKNMRVVKALADAGIDDLPVSLCSYFKTITGETISETYEMENFNEKEMPVSLEDFKKAVIEKDFDETDDHNCLIEIDVTKLPKHVKTVRIRYGYNI